MYNFIDGAVRSRLTLPLHQGCHGLRVLVANDDCLTSGGICKQLAFQASQETFAVDCYSILLSWFDIIPGAQWLETLGPIVWDFCRLTSYNHLPCRTYPHQSGRRPHSGATGRFH